MSRGATPDPEVIESGPAPRLLGPRLRARCLTFVRHVLTWRVLLGVALLSAIFALATAVQQYRHRVAAEDRVSLATGIDTSVSVDLSTRTLIFDLFIANRSRYAVTLDNISVVTSGLAVVPGAAGGDGGAALLPARVPGGQSFETTLILRPDCTKRLPVTPEFRIVATTSRGGRHIRVLPTAAPLAQLWATSVRSACSDKPQ
jgi:hypothetical protein